MRDFRDAATSLPRSPSVKIADEVRRYYIEDWIIELQLTRNGLTSVTRSSPPLEASSTLIRIVDMLRGVDSSRSHSDRILSSRLLSKVDDASWILISIIRESFLVKRPQWDHHSLQYRLVISFVLIHGFHKKPTLEQPIDFLRECSVRDYRRLIRNPHPLLDIYEAEKRVYSRECVLKDKAESKLVVLFLSSEQDNSPLRLVNLISLRMCTSATRELAFDPFAKILHGITTEEWPKYRSALVTAYTYVYMCVTRVCKWSTARRVSWSSLSHTCD